MKNLYYFHSILEIGGIETFFYYLAKKYKDWDLTIIYRYGNEKQLERLKPYVRCIQYQEGQEYECERAFFNFNTDIIEHVHATNGYYLVIHGDYKDMVQRGQLSIKNMPGHPKITNYVGVSKKACESFEELTGHKCILCYNPFEPDVAKKPLRLISPTRLSVEKGGQRIAAMANRMDELGIPFTWDIYSNRTIDTKLSPNIHIHEPTLDIQSKIAAADFLVQLSDNEGYCYSVVEAWGNGVPVIITPIPVLKEIGADNTNSIILDFDLKNVDEVIKTMVTKHFNFKYIPKKDCWDELLIPGESEYQIERNSLYLVEATKKYQLRKCTDTELKRIPAPGERWTVTRDRYELLAGGNPNKVQYVRLIEQIKK